MSSWTLFARAPDGERSGQIETFTKATLVPKWNNVGTFVLEGLVPAEATALGLLAPGAGIEAVRDGSTVLSGPFDRRHRKFSEDTNALTLSGVDDVVWLRRRLTHPAPLAAPTGSPPVYGTAARDVRSGAISTLIRAYVDVNAGPGAAVARRVPGLTIGPDPVAGFVATVGARWWNLLDWVRLLAYYGQVGFRVVDLELDVYVPVDRSGEVVFSLELGNLKGFEFTSEAPDADYAYVGGQGEGIARAIVEDTDSAAVATWGRSEVFVDRRDATTVAELGIAATKALADGAAKDGISIAPVDTPGRAFGTDYNLGDKVKVVVEGEEVIDVIAEVTLTIGQDGEVIEPAIGNPNAFHAVKLFDRLAAAEARIRNLEAR